MARRRSDPVPPAAIVLLVLLLCVLADPARASDPAYLSQWPTVSRVLADERGADEHDGWARQMAALDQLDRAIEDMADERRWNALTKDELALRGRYRQAAEKIRQQAHAALANDLGPGFHWPWEEAPLQAWNSLQWGYESDPAFRHATLSRYLAPGLLAELDARKAASDARAHAAGRRMLEELGYRESTWSAIGPAGQDVVASAIAALLVMLVLLLVREFRRFGLRPDDPMQLQAGYRRYPLEFITGIVDDYQSNSGGYNEGFKLWLGWGWYQVGVQDVYVLIPEDRLATAVEAHGARRRRKSSAYVLFFDHDAPATRPANRVLRRLLAPSRLLYVPLAGLGLLVGAASDLVPSLPPVVNGALGGVAGWVLVSLLSRWRTQRRIRRFLDVDAPRLFDAAGRQAERPPPPPPLPQRP